MIRKNDSKTYICKWGKTITPKLNWHISEHSIYNRNRSNKNRLQDFNWGNRAIGVHYTDRTNRYEKRLISEYEVLKIINKTIKKHTGISGTMWSNKITMHSYKEFQKIIHMAQNIAKKYGFNIIRSEYENHFPYIKIERVYNYYTHQFL